MAEESSSSWCWEEVAVTLHIVERAGDKIWLELEAQMYLQSPNHRGLFQPVIKMLQSSPIGSIQLRMNVSEPKLKLCGDIGDISDSKGIIWELGVCKYK